MSEKKPDSAEIDSAAASPAVEPDTQSDPALDEGEGSEWSSEGGAVEEGPATDVDDV